MAHCHICHYKSKNLFCINQKISSCLEGEKEGRRGGGEEVRGKEKQTEEEKKKGKEEEKKEEKEDGRGEEGTSWMLSKGYISPLIRNG